MSNSSSAASANKIRTSQRRSLACQACTKKKIKCDKQIPCSRCRRLHLECSREVVRIKQNVVQHAAEIQFLNSITKDLEEASASGLQPIIERLKKRTHALQFGDNIPHQDDGMAESNQVNTIQILESQNEKSHETTDPSLLTTLEHFVWGRTSGKCFPHTSCSCRLSKDGAILSPIDPPFWDASVDLQDGIAHSIPSVDARKLIQFHVQHLAWHHDCLHAPTLQEQCEIFWNTGRSVHPLWPATYLSILSATVFAIQNSQKAIRTVDLDLSLLPSAEQLFTGMIHVLYSSHFLRDVSIYTVQAIVISTEVAHNLGQSQLNATLFNSAVRIAESLGLHRIGTGSALEGNWNAKVNIEVGKRVWCQMMIQDHFAIPFTESYTISPGHVSTSLPLNADDHDLIDMPPHIPTVSSYVLVLNKMAALMPDLLNGLDPRGDRKSTQLQYEHVLNMDTEMRETVKRFPQFFLTHDVEMELRLPWLSIARRSLGITAAEKIIMIHRPFLFRSFISPLYDHTRRTCTAAAMTILREHEALVMADDLSVWTHTAFCITAAVILCFAINHLSEGDGITASKYKAAILGTKERLKPRRSDLLAQRGVVLIDVLMEELSSQKISNLGSSITRILKRMDVELSQEWKSDEKGETPYMVMDDYPIEDMSQFLGDFDPTLEAEAEFDVWFRSLFNN
ncbi:hypothetical protein EDB80DRAFT_895783 [Ilyonectria destructans]|nr:hypothetical protein EDB80DRAFT_895783 [Ilyonectria destructans]